MLPSRHHGVTHITTLLLCQPRYATSTLLATLHIILRPGQPHYVTPMPLATVPANRHRYYSTCTSYTPSYRFLYVPTQHSSHSPDTPHTTTISDVTCGRLTTHMYLTSQQAQASATTLIAPKEPPHSNKDTTNLTMPSDHGELQKSSFNSTTKPKHRPLPRAPWRDLLSPTKTKRKAPHTSAPRLRNNFDIK
ncbi:hypothetical protein Pcinc_007615 [Petrolisthes cinctipes]|uniref:Uncharacterized protein n=1 Tax=Petrolisthes cinctipes TaxID=88211 RepID=A0AAE1L0B2_PETCI|nr:hypothetical protein Pcinc_007615 [Petrolisthes cinctipes]